MADDRTQTDAEPVAEQGDRPARGDRFFVVFVLIIATIIANAALSTGPAGMSFIIVLQLITAVAALWSSEVDRRIYLVVAGVGSLVVISIIVGFFTTYWELARFAYFATMLVLVTMTPIAIVRRILSHLRVDIATVLGAADIYLLFGLFFAVVFGLIGEIIKTVGQTNAQAFFVAARTPIASDFIYYSYTTLATVGYGDLTASTALGRMLSVTEALLGQLYLVTVVALLISNIGRERQPRRIRGDAD